MASGNLENADPAVKAVVSGGASRKRHPVWEFFSYDAELKKSTCLVKGCKSTLSNSFTTNLKKHLKGHHNISLEAEAPANQIPLTNSEGTEFLAKYPPENKRQSEFDDVLAVMIGSTSTPLRFVENPDFNKLIHVANPRLTVCGRTRLNRLINEKTEGLVDLLRKEIQFAKHVSLGLDLWTKRGLTSSYLGIVASFFSTIQMKKMTMTLAVAEMPGPFHRKEDILPVFEAVMAKYGIQPNQIIRILTDAGSNMIAAFKGTETLIEEVELFEDILDEFEAESHDQSILEVTNHQNMKCFIHQLIRAAKLGFESVDKQSSMILNKVQELVKKINSSTVLTKSIVEKSGKQIIGYSTTRWNVLYLVCRRLLQVKAAVNEVLEATDKTKYKLNEAEWEFLGEVAEFLDPLYTFTTTCSSDANGVSEGVPIYRQLKIHLAEYETSENSFLRQCSLAVSKQLDNRFGHFFSENGKEPFDGIFLLATMLDIRYRRALQPLENEKATDYLESFVNTFYKRNEMDSTMSNAVSSPPAKRRKFSFIQAKATTTQTSLRQEVSLYLNNSQFDTDDEDANPIQFWTDNRNTFPNLWITACEVLSIPISTANVEQVFSIATYHTSGRRGKLEGDNLEREVFLNKNKSFI